MKKYRRLTELTDKEIEELLQECVAPKKIKDIERNKESNEVYAVITTIWGDKKEEIEDNITLTETEYLVDWGIEPEDTWQYRQYLFALGVNPLTIDNPYLKNTRKTRSIKQDEKTTDA